MATLQEFIDRGMAFFSGEHVSKAELTTATEKIAGLEKDLKDSRATATTLTTERDTARTEVATANKALETRTSELTTAKARVAELEKSQQSVSQKAAEITAAQGIPVAQVPATPDPGANGGDLFAQRAAIKDPTALAEFDAKHGKALFAQARSGLRKERQI